MSFSGTPSGGTSTGTMMSLCGGGLGGLQVGSPTGGDKGLGTVNAIQVYANNTLLTSDARDKCDIVPLTIDALALVAAIEPKAFKHNPPPVPEPIMTADGPIAALLPPDEWFDRIWWGFLAQDVEDATDGLEWDGVVTGKDGEHKAISQGCLLACLWQAVRQLKSELDQLKAN